MKRATKAPITSRPLKKRKLDNDLYDQFSDASNRRCFDELTKDSTDAGYISAKCTVKYPQENNYFKLSARIQLSTGARVKVLVIFRGEWVNTFKIGSKQFSPGEGFQISLRGCTVCKVEGENALLYEDGVCFALPDGLGGEAVYDTWALPNSSLEGDEWVQSPLLRSVAELQADGDVYMAEEQAAALSQGSIPSLSFLRTSQSEEEEDVAPGSPEWHINEDDEWMLTQASTRNTIVVPDGDEISRLSIVEEELESPEERGSSPTSESQKSQEEKQREVAAGSLPTPKSSPGPPEQRTPPSTYPLSFAVDDLPSSFQKLLDNAVEQNPVHDQTEADQVPVAPAPATPISLTTASELEPRQLRPVQQLGDEEWENLGRKEKKRLRQKQKKAEKFAQQKAERQATSMGSVDDQSRAPVPASTGVPLPIARHASASDNAVAGPSRVQVQPIARSHSAPGGGPARDSAQGPTKQTVASTSNSATTTPGAVTVQIQGPGNATAGSVAQGMYTSLGSLKAGRTFNVVGRVTKLTTDEPHVKDGEFYISVNLTDSTLDGHIVVYCNEKEFVEWLPAVSVGDILVLHDVWCRKYGNLNGRPRRYKWAVYDPNTAQFKDLDLKKAPRSVGNYSPFATRSAETVEKCKEVAQMPVSSTRGGVAPTARHVHDLGAADSPRPGPARRRHRLLEEAGPEEEPRGFFDCTVEVLGGGDSNGCYNLNVVDYTIPKSVWPNDNKQIPEAQRKYVLTIECEKSAYKAAMELQICSFYRIENCRVKWKGQHVQASLHENKFKQLSLDIPGRDKELEELLKRKAKLKFPNAPTIRSVDHNWLKDIDKSGPATLIVEMIHGEPAPNGGDFYFIFVTDFTYNKDKLPDLNLLFPKSQPSSSQRLEHRILKILLDNGQQEYGSRMQVGKTYKLVNALVKPNSKWPCRSYIATLGGREKRIQELDDGSEEWQALQDSKNRWLGQRVSETTEDVEPEAPHFDLSKVPGRCFQPAGVPVNQWPSICTMLCRVVSMDPGHLHLEDCSPLYCGQCDQPLPKSMGGLKYTSKRCPNCKLHCDKRMLSFHLTVEERTSGLRFPVYVNISENNHELPLAVKLKKVAGTSKPGNVDNAFYRSSFEKFLQSIIGDEEQRDSGGFHLKYGTWMVYTCAKYDSAEQDGRTKTHVVLCDFEKP